MSTKKFLQFIKVAKEFGIELTRENLYRFINL